jgi:hypothetical protein
VIDGPRCDHRVCHGNQKTAAGTVLARPGRTPRQLVTHGRSYALTDNYGQ